MKNRWILAFLVACGLAYVFHAWLRMTLRDVPPTVQVLLTAFLLGAYVGLVSLSIEIPTHPTPRSGSFRRADRPDIALPWWLQTSLAILLAGVTAALWGAGAEATTALLCLGLIAGATAHWWVWLMQVSPWYWR